MVKARSKTENQNGETEESKERVKINLEDKEIRNKSQKASPRRGGMLPVKAVAAQKAHHLVHPVRNQPLLPLLEGPAQ